MSEIKSINDYPTASEILHEGEFEGTLVSPRDILDRTLLLLDAHERQGDYGAYFVMHLFDPEHDVSYRASCGGKVVCNKLRRLLELKALPCRVTLRKIDRYYDIF